MKVALAMVFGLVSGFGAFAFMRWLPSMIRGQMEPFNAFLTQTGVEPNDVVSARLEAQAARRHVWGAVGAGVGYAISFTTAMLLSPSVIDGASGVLGVVGLWFGSAVGHSASALFPVDHPNGPVLVTAIQPHGITEYLHRREILVEISLGVLGWVSALVGTLVLTSVIDNRVIRHNATSMLLVGALVAVVATTTLLGQRRLVAAPLRADDEDGLVTADIVLALGLRDLLAVTIATAAMAAWMTLWLPGRAWWVVALFALAALVAVRVTLGLRKRPNSLPIAHRLAVRSRAA